MSKEDKNLTNFHNSSQIRKEYTKADLPDSQMLPSPLEQFRAWYELAIQKKIEEPNAMALATANQDGKVSLRFVLLKGFDSAGFSFYTNYQSKKAQDLSQNPFASIAIYWKELEKQIRIEGHVERLTDLKNDEYFAERPRQAQLGAWASKQSTPLGSREELEKIYSEYEQKYAANEKISRPEHWGGFLLKPERYEFWQGRVGRLHDRFEYVRRNQIWEIQRLFP